MSTLYIVKEGLSGFSRAKLAALGSIVTITLALLLLGLFYVVSMNTSRLVENIRQKVEMEAFLQEPINARQTEELRKQILNVSGIDSVAFISKEDAAKVFKEEFGEDINKVLEFNPLPPSFKIFLQDKYRTTLNAAEISRTIENLKGVDNVIYRREMLEFIDKQANVLKLIGLGLGILIGISAIFLVSNTIRLTIVAKRKSIQTMKLVGASRWFVRAPFLIEGMVQGVLGGAIAAALIYYILTFAAALISTELAQFIRVENLFYYEVVAVGIFLGLFGSAVSVRRFIGETVAG